MFSCERESVADRRKNLFRILPIGKPGISVAMCFETRLAQMRNEDEIGKYFDFSTQIKIKLVLNLTFADKN